MFLPPGKFTHNGVACLLLVFPISDRGRTPGSVLELKFVEGWRMTSEPTPQLRLNVRVIPPQSLRRRRGSCFFSERPLLHLLQLGELALEHLGGWGHADCGGRGHVAPHRRWRDHVVSHRRWRHHVVARARGGKCIIGKLCRLGGGRQRLA